MSEKETKVMNRKEKQQKDQGTVRAMLEARVPSARYELYAKPASHPTAKSES